MRAYAAAAATLVLLVGPPGPPLRTALADEANPRTQAAEHFRAAERAYLKRAYTLAAEEFESAHRLVPHAATQMNAADAWERAGELDRAAELADGILRSSMSSERAEREAASTLLARIAPKLAILDIMGSPKTRVRVASREVVPPLRLRLKPGSYAVVVAGLGALDKSLRVELGAGDAKTLDVGTPAPTPAPETAEVAAASPPLAPPPLPTTTSRKLPALAWVSFGLAAGAAGAFSVLGIRTLDAKRAFEVNPTVGSRGEFYDFRTASNLALGAAGALAATGLLLWLTASPTPSRDSLAGSLAVGPSGAFFASDF